MAANPIIERIVAASAALLLVASVVAAIAHRDDNGTKASSGRLKATAAGGQTAPGAIDEASGAGDAAQANAGAGTSTGKSTVAGGSTGSAEVKGSTATGGHTASTTKPFTLGIYKSQTGNAASAFGVKIPDVTPEELQALVAWINAHGGMGGRQVKPELFVNDPTIGSFDSQAQEACAHFSEDKKVDAVISGALGATDVLPACLAQHKTPLVWSNPHMVTNAFSDPILEYLYRPAGPNGDRLAFAVDVLANAGFFKPGAKIALAHYDNGAANFVARKIYEPALRRHGLTVTFDFAMSDAKSAGQAADSSAEASAAVLQMKRLGVDHVLFVPSDGGIPLLFLVAAESQNYRPRYGMTTFDNPFFLSTNIPAAQLKDAQVVGWSVATDTDQTHDPRPKDSPSRQCHAIEASAGQPSNFGIESWCNMLFFLKAALDAQPEGSPAAIRRAVEAFGTGYPSRSGFGTRFAPGRHDGLREVRRMVFDGGSGRFTYTGPLIDVG